LSPRVNAFKTPHEHLPYFRSLLFRTARITLRDGRNRDDLVPRARCPPRAVEDDAEERLPVLAAEERAVQALRTRNRAEELAVGRKHVHRLARRHIQPSLLIDRGSVATLAALQLAELALIGQRAVGVHVEGVDDRAVGRIQRLLVGTENDAVGERHVLPELRDDALRAGVEDAAVSRAGDGEVDAAEAFKRLAVERLREHPALRLELLDAAAESAFGDEQPAVLAARDGARGV